MGFGSFLSSALGTIGNAITPGLGSVISGGLSLIGGNSQNSAQAALANQQMDFQERLSNTAYQRAKADMEAAGYNPALAYTNGGASTPGGAMAPVNNALGGAVNSALSAYQVGTQMQNTSADTKLKSAQTLKTLNEAGKSDLGGAVGRDLGNVYSTLRNSALDAFRNKDGSHSFFTDREKARMRGWFD